MATAATPPQESIAKFCQSERELKRGQALLARAKRPLLRAQRDARARLLARLEALRLRGANVRVGDQCYRLTARQQTTRRAVTPRIIRRAVGADADADAEDSKFPTEAITIEDLGKWVWARLQAARTVSKPGLSITAAKNDLATVLPADAHLPALGAGGTPEDRENAEEKERLALQALMQEHARAQHALRTIGQENKEAKEALRAQSAAAQPAVLAYMEAQDVQVQPVRVGDEQFSMRRRQTNRIIAPTKASDIHEVIDKALRSLLATEGEYNPDRVLTPEELAACAPRLAGALDAALPRRRQARVALLRRPNPKAKKSVENNNTGAHAGGEASPHRETGTKTCNEPTARQPAL